MYLVVCTDRSAPRSALLLEAARATMLCTDAFASTPAWGESFRAWGERSFRKVTLRARGSAWSKLTALDADRSAFVEDQLLAGGFDCSTLGDGTMCAIEQKGVTLDDEPYTSGETHFVGGGGWVSTAWINFHPEGYTEDIVDTLWG